MPRSPWVVLFEAKTHGVSSSPNTGRAGLTPAVIGVLGLALSIRGSFPMAKKVCLFVTPSSTVISYHQHHGPPKLGWALPEWEVLLVMLARLSHTRTRNILAIGAMAVLAGVLFVPGLAAAKTSALKFVGIQGTNGNQADVTPANQLYTTNAPPASLFAPTSVPIPSGTNLYPILTPADQDDIVTSLGVDFVSPGDIDLYLSAPDCEEVYANVRILTDSTPSDTEVTFPTGLAVPNGDSLCVSNFNDAAGFVNVDGYSVPAGTVSSAKAQTGAALKRPSLP
jgi:hypothetical protein